MGVGGSGKASHLRLYDSEMALDAAVRSDLVSGIEGGLTDVQKKGNKLSLSFPRLLYCSL